MYNEASTRELRDRRHHLKSALLHSSGEEKENIEKDILSIETEICYRQRAWQIREGQ